MRRPSPVCCRRSTGDLSESQGRLDQVRQEAREEVVEVLAVQEVLVRPPPQPASQLRHLAPVLRLRLPRRLRLPLLSAR